MKHVLIVIPSFEIGGTIVSLYSLLEGLDSKKVSIDIYARQHKGPFINKLPNSKILNENIWLASCIYKLGFWSRVLFLILKRIRNVFGLININLYPIYSYIGGKQIGSEKYDSIISYQEDLNRLVCFYPAQKRIAWMHCDYHRYIKLLGRNDESKFYKYYEYIVCVSKFAKSRFDEFLPQYMKRSICIYNTINPKNILNKALLDENLDIKFNTDFFTIVSVGRIDPVKQFDLIPFIANRLKELYNDNFRWYIIGGTPNSKLIDLIENNIKLYNVENIVIYLGEKDNIYPYIKKSNLLVHTSKSESFSLVVHEAMALQVPVILNNIEVASEVICNGVDGIISDISDMPREILKVIQHEYVFKGKQFSIEDNINKFYSIL